MRLCHSQLRWAQHAQLNVGCSCRALLSFSAPAACILNSSPTLRQHHSPRCPPTIDTLLLMPPSHHHMQLEILNSQLRANYQPLPPPQVRAVNSKDVLKRHFRGGGQLKACCALPSFMMVIHAKATVQFPALHPHNLPRCQRPTPQSPHHQVLLSTRRTLQGQPRCCPQSLGQEEGTTP
jgi:hypothetical protein